MPVALEPDAEKPQSRPVAGRSVHRVEVKPELLQWACNRSGRSRLGPTAENLEKKFPKLEAWKQGKVQPTLKQLEAFARATRTPIGYLFLQTPPVEVLPVSDFRTIGDVEVTQPSPDLLDTLYLCQRRQDWYSNEAWIAGEEPLDFVGSLTVDNEIESAAASIRDALGFDIDQRRQEATWTGALRQFIEHVDEVGVLVMVSGVVGNNTSRKLDTEEFLGFALSDPLAPLIFINGATSKSTQMFTLAHETAHIWLGRSGVSNSQIANIPNKGIELWCNKVAAEMLVPSNLIRKELNTDTELDTEISRLARHFKVSTLVVLRRIYDIKWIDRDEFWSAWWAEVERLKQFNKGSGGNYYLSVNARASKRFARALAISTLEDRTTFTEAMRLLDIKKVSSLEKIAQSLGVQL